MSNLMRTFSCMPLLLSPRLTTKIPTVCALTFAALLTACGGSNSGAPLVENPAPIDTGEGGTVTVAAYEGPDALSADRRNFQTELWEPLRATDRCGGCHVQDDQAPFFVRNDDVNAAYDAAISLVNLESPSLSRLVEKVDSGHNCWATTEPADFCGDVIETLISNWSVAGDVEINQVVLVEPVIKEVGVSKSFPADTALFQPLYEQLSSDVYGCKTCHAESTDLQQQPYFASADIGVAYDAVKTKISLSSPADSRLVYRLRTEGHNCWSSSCSADSDAMEQAIQAFADSIAVTPVDPDLVVSRMLLLDDGVQASSGGRVENNAVALYRFKPNELNQALDTSGVDPALHLDFVGDVEWVGSWGVTIEDGRLQGQVDASQKIYTTLKETGEYAIEAWVTPFNVTQEGPARIVTYSGNANSRNFMLGQTLYNYNFLTRSSETGIDGMPMLSTPDADEVLQASLQHVVVNYDPLVGRSIYVNGELISQDETGGNLNSWKDDFVLAAGSEVDGDYVWRGTLRMLAIHNRAIAAENIVTNFEAGVGQKIFMLFSVSHLVDMPSAYIVFQAQQFDNYSYLFNNPYFLSLDDEATVPSSGIRIKGMRLGVNGQEASIGQAFANIDVTVTADNYAAVAETETEAGKAKGTILSDLGALVAVDQGADADEFFLSFDIIGNESYARPAELPPVPEDVEIADVEYPDIGVRHFAEINATLAQTTTVEPTTDSVLTVYETVQQQMPTSEDLDGFLSAHQAGVMQLSVAYCTALVNDTSKRATYFSGFDFSSNYTAAFSTAGRAQIIDPLMTALLAAEMDVDGSSTALTTQPDPADMRAELNNLIDTMSSADTSTVVIATCATAVGSAVMLLQ